MTRLVDISGGRYGSLLVIERAPRQPGDKHTKWVCRCDCGDTSVATYINLKSGNTTSCGCKRRPHGGTGNPTWRCWHSMMRRCVWKSNSRRYQGIVPVCERWRDYGMFLADLGERPSLGHSLDRIDNAKGYEPGNVRWATAREQCGNKTNNRWIEVRGERKILTDWARHFGVTPASIRQYMARHGSLDTYPRLIASVEAEG